METLFVTPFVGVNDMKFGMPIDELKKILGKPDDLSNDSTLFWWGCQLRVFLDSNQCVDGIGFRNHGNLGFHVDILGISLFDTKAEDLIMQLSAKSGHTYDEDFLYDYDIPELKLHLWREYTAEELDASPSLKFFPTQGWCFEFVQILK